MSESYPNIQLRQRLKGLAIPFLLLIAVLGGMASIVVPRLNARLKLGRESATISSLITICANEMQFKNRRLRFATLEELAESSLLDRNYTGGKSVYGYVFSTSGVSAETYCVHATRAGGATAYHDFVVCEDGIIRMVESKTPGVVKRGEGSDLRSKLSSRYIKMPATRAGLLQLRRSVMFIVIRRTMSPSSVRSGIRAWPDVAPDGAWE